MRFSEFKKHKRVRLAIDLGDLQVFHPENGRLIQLVKNPRSYQDDTGVWHVYPVGFRIGGSQLFIACPYCGEVHGHSNYPGYRVPHCHVRDGHKNYCIEIMPGDMRDIT